MKVQRTSHSSRMPRRSAVSVVFLLVCALLTHSLDDCAEHLGILVAEPHGVQQVAAPCDDGPCSLCTPQDNEHQDCCDPSAETGVLASHAQPLEHPVDTPAILVPADSGQPQLVALHAGCLHGRAQPPPGPYLATDCRTSLPDRAPPISA